jgi:hypothetical protein
MEPSVNQDQLKDLIKATRVEVLEQRRDLLHDALAEALADIALVRAIEEGASREWVERTEGFDLLEGKV